MFPVFPTPPLSGYLMCGSLFRSLSKALQSAYTHKMLQCFKPTLTPPPFILSSVSLLRSLSALSLTVVLHILISCSAQYLSMKCSSFSRPLHNCYRLPLFCKCGATECVCEVQAVVPNPTSLKISALVLICKFVHTDAVIQYLS